MNPEKGLIDAQAKKIYKTIREQLVATGLEYLDVDTSAIVDYANLERQKLLFLDILKQEGYVVTNVNARGGKTHQQHPAYRNYISCIQESYKFRAKLGLTPKDRQNLSVSESESDGFDEIF